METLSGQEWSVHVVEHRVFRGRVINYDPARHGYVRTMFAQDIDFVTMIGLGHLSLLVVNMTLAMVGGRYTIVYRRRLYIQH